MMLNDQIGDGLNGGRRRMKSGFGSLTDVGDDDNQRNSH